MPERNEGLGLRHAWVREGDKLPCDRRHILHIQGREEGTDLDIWWYGFPENEEDD